MKQGQQGEIFATTDNDTYRTDTDKGWGLNWKTASLVVKKGGTGSREICPVQGSPKNSCPLPSPNHLTRMLSFKNEQIN